MIAELEALVAQHPLRERLRGQLMLALYRSGRQADALRVYQETRDVLVEELGLEPSPALQRLEKAVLKQDPALEVAEAVRPDDGGAAPSLPVPETRKTVSVVSADIISLDGPHDPEALGRPMARAVETVTDVLERHGASTEPSIGGGVIGIFGVPRVHEDDALRAVRAASRRGLRREHRPGAGARVGNHRRPAGRRLDRRSSGRKYGRAQPRGERRRQRCRPTRAGGRARRILVGAKASSGSCAMPCT